jgi:hypothetical protein
LQSGDEDSENNEDPEHFSWSQSQIFDHSLNSDNSDDSLLEDLGTVPNENYLMKILAINS